MPLSAQEKQQMQVSVTTLKSQIDALVVDTVVPVPPTADSGLWTRHNSAYMGKKVYRPVIVNAQGQPGNPPVESGPFYGEAIALPEGRVIWGEAVEHHKVISGLGSDWGGLLGFGSTKIDAGETLTAVVEPVSVDWINLDTNTNTNLTAVTAQGKFGHVMCPQVLPASGNYRIRVWFWAWPSMTSARQFPGYWQCDYHFGRTVTNLAWKGAGPQARRGIVYEEAWWDPGQGWVAGGTSPALPWVNEVPVVVNVTYDGSAAFGEDAGTLWQYYRPSVGYNVALSTVQTF